MGGTFHDSDDSTPADPAGIDDVFEALSDRRRRQALYHLQQVGGRATLTDLIARVLAHGRGIEPSAVDAGAIQREHLEFYHRHLPLLESVGALEYDDDGGVVRLTADRDDLERHLELALDAEAPGLAPD